MGVTFQENCKYSKNVRAKLIKANKVTFLLAKFFSDSDNPDCTDFRASRNKNLK